MAGGVGDYLSKKHPQHGKENDAPISRQELAQRKSFAQGLKLQPGAGRRSHSASSSGVPFRDTVSGPPRTGSPLAMQQVGVHNGFASQGRNQVNGQGQDYPERGHLWNDSTLDSDSLDTVKDGPFDHYDNGDDHELADTQGRHVEGYDQEVRLSDQRSDSDPEEEEVDQDNIQYHQNYNGYPRQPGMNQTSIPVRGHTGRFVGESQAQQRQSPVMETVLSNGKKAANWQGYGQKKMPGRPGHQVQEDGDQQLEVDTFAPSEVNEDTMQSVAGNGGIHHGHSSKRHADDISDLDFDRETLSKMPYEKLKNQPFDEDPNQAESPVAQLLAGAPQSLGARMELFKTRPADERAAFFASLTIDEWEEAGEWLMTQFGTVMGKVVDARRDRRKVAAGFEDKLAARDAEVKETTDGVASALQQLKNGGQDLLRGRTPA
ncbi:hypothetical protein V495_05916 [Pseudogymnoascus sp. VKM F-4514 (FW-929)]|nr:hypothetical protein V495_05916 [Pseudogymnoascus sp. VKM F-4514 (FW-929)]KFY58014.1 hypothetical protein V497_05127 [Pseudogymnoascus sp. VKM F-4516 (FW-969)]